MKKSFIHSLTEMDQSMLHARRSMMNLARQMVEVSPICDRCGHELHPTMLPEDQLEILRARHQATDECKIGEVHIQ